MYRALQIANYIIHQALKKGTEVTNLHLQKILYYLQAASLYNTGNPLFDGSIEKWRLGPVIPDVYHEYKEYGSRPISGVANEIVFDPETMDIKHVQFKENDISEETRNSIDPLINKLLNQSPSYLVNQTHLHDPWKDYRERIEDGERGLQYTNEEIQEYFKEHPEMLQEVLGGTFRDGSYNK